ncbi:MAG: hypothetical protein Q8R92_17015, partial [Deltaproteobacteria bacterium]|nr:hypothetical protein [Deltaproteobacteria bacterium]
NQQVIEMKLGEIVNSREAIANVLAAKLPIKAAYQLSRIGLELSKEIEAFTAARNAAITSLGTCNEGGAFEIKVTHAEYPEFERQMNELLAADVKIDRDPVRMQDLGDKAEVSASDLIVCSKFITE